MPQVRQRWNGTSWDTFATTPNPTPITPPDGGDPGEPETTALLVGAAVQNGAQSAFNSLESTIGPLMVYRSYDSGFPATWSQGSGSWVPDRVVSWHSLKPSVPNTASGSLDTQLTTWVQSIPATHQCMLTFQHEPENPTKNIDPGQFRQAFGRFYDIVKANRPDILVGPIYMSWTFDPASGRNPMDWWPGDTKADFIGVDTYETYAAPEFGSGTTWHPAPEAAYVTACNFGVTHGVRPAIGEFKSGWGPPNSTDIAAKVQWITDTIDYTVTMNGIAVCYFDVIDPRGTAPGGYIEDDQQTIDYFTGVLLNPPQVVVG